MIDHVKTWQQRARKFEVESHKLLAKYETSASRVVELNALIKSLSGLPVDVEGYFREAADCLQYGNLRAAIVMSWAGFFSVFMDSFYKTKNADIKAKYGSWDTASVEGLKESAAEGTLLVAARTLKFAKAGQIRIYDGQLSLRNQCAHPTLYSPTPNAAIGFVDQMVSQTRLYL
ncbi:MAG: hypothetical protein ACREQ8_14585 [Woeseiaceae bacterium]